MKLNLMKQFFLLAGFAFLLTSCDPDIIDPIGEADPIVTVSGFPTGEIAAGSTFTITVNATPSTTNALKAVQFTANSTKIPFANIKVNGSAASSNPILLFGADKNSLTWTVDIVAQSDASTIEYAVLVTDDGNNDDSFKFDVTTGVTAPTISLSGDMNVELNPGAIFSFVATLGKGTYDLASLAVYQGDNLIPDAELSRLAYGQLTTKFDKNPYLLPVSEQDGGTVTLYLKVQQTVETVAYRYVLTDNEGNSSDATLTVTSISNVEEIQGVLFNAAGPTGTGGLDLDAGKGTGSSDATAEIRDQGSDFTKPAATNWRQKISGVNGSVVKYLVPGMNGLAEDFTYAGVASQATVASLFDNGIAFTETNGSGTLTSGVVKAGDTFIVRNGANNYLITIKEVNIIATSEQTNSNADNYVIDIKK